MVQPKIRLNNQKARIEQPILHQTAAKLEANCSQCYSLLTGPLQPALHHPQISKQAKRGDPHPRHHRQ